MIECFDAEQEVQEQMHLMQVQMQMEAASSNLAANAGSLLVYEKQDEMMAHNGFDHRDSTYMQYSTDETILSPGDRIAVLEREVMTLRRENTYLREACCKREVENDKLKSKLDKVKAAISDSDVPNNTSSATPQQHVPHQQVPVRKRKLPISRTMPIMRNIRNPDPAVHCVPPPFSEAEAMELGKRLLKCRAIEGVGQKSIFYLLRLPSVGFVKRLEKFWRTGIRAGITLESIARHRTKIEQFCQDVEAKIPKVEEEAPQLIPE